MIGLYTSITCVCLAVCSVWPGGAVREYTHNLIPLFGIVVVWQFAGWLLSHAKRVAELLIALSGASFFLFATHEPLMEAIRKVAYVAIAPKNAATEMAIYLLLPLFLIVVLVLLYQIVIRIVPQRMLVLAGVHRSMSNLATPKMEAASVASE